MINQKKTPNSWVMAIRPKTLPAGAGPVLLGLALAYHRNPQSFSWLVAILTLACTLLLQISSNLINDYYDGVSGIDDHNRLGPIRATSSGLIPAPKVKKGFILTLGFALILGLFLMKVGGVPIIIIGLCSLFFSWAYTGGPYPLSHYGLGELFAFIFFGPVAVWGTWFLQTRNFTATASLNALFWGAALGVQSAALMGINNLRDRHSDKLNGKHTLATIIGGHTMRKIIFLLIVMAHLIALSLIKGLHIYQFIGVTPLFIFSKQWWGLLHYTEGRDLNDTLATVGKHIFLFSLCYGVIILL